MNDLVELKKAITDQGTAWETWKASQDEQLAALKKGGWALDPVLVDRITKIEKSLDTAVEMKAAVEARFVAEQKEREALELRLSKPENKGLAVEEVECKQFNLLLAGHAAEKKQLFTPLDMSGYNAYKSAFDSYVRKGDRLLSNDEMKTLSVGSDPDGGYYVTPDVSGRIVKKVYETSPMRQVASVITISTDAIEGVEDLGEAGVGYAGEQALSGDQTTPQIGKWRIPTFNLDTEPKATQNLLDDSAVDVEAWLAGKVADKFGRFENSEFINGALAKIRGFVAGGYTFTEDTTGAGVNWGEVAFIKTGANGDFAASSPADKLFDLIAWLKNAYLPGSSWVTKRLVINKIRKFKEATTNAYMWQPGLQSGVPEQLLGFPVSRCEDMPTLATNSLSLAFGNFKEAYTIVDRQGIRVLRDQYTSKPFIKFYTTKRVGGGLVNFEAIKLLKFAT